MSDTRLASAVLAASAAAVAVGVVGQLLWMLMLGLTLAWLATCCSSLMVQDRARSLGWGRPWAFVQLLVCVSLPLGACGWAMLGAAVAERFGGGERAGNITAVLLPVGMIGVANSIALRRWHMLGLAAVLSVALAASGFAGLALKEGTLLLAWCALTGVAIAQLIALRLARPPSEGPETCTHCGYDLRGLRRGAVCPECGRER